METQEGTIAPKKEINSLKHQLDEVHNQKETWYTKKETLKNEIRTLIQAIRGVKKNLDQSKTIKDAFRKKRDAFNAQSKELIDQIRKKDREKRGFMKKRGIRDDLSGIKAKIEKLEYTLETEALSFDKEKKLMGRIKEAKKKLGAVAVLERISIEITEVRRKLEETQQQANLEHQNFISQLEKERTDLQAFKELSQKITELQKGQEDAFQSFKKLKQEFSELNAGLHEKLIETSKRYAQARSHRQEALRKREVLNNQLIEMKAKNVEEKIKTKKKLTTEDLLVFQVNDKKKD